MYATYVYLFRWTSLKILWYIKRMIKILGSWGFCRVYLKIPDIKYLWILSIYNEVKRAKAIVERRAIYSIMLENCVLTTQRWNFSFLPFFYYYYFPLFWCWVRRRTAYMYVYIYIYIRMCLCFRCHHKIESY